MAGVVVRKVVEEVEESAVQGGLGALAYSIKAAALLSMERGAGVVIMAAAVVGLPLVMLQAAAEGRAI